MTKQTKQWLAIGAGVVVLYLLLKPKKVTTASSAEDKMKLANQPADADTQLRKECEREVAINPRPTVVQSDEKWAIYNENQIAACMERKKIASTIAAGVDVDSQLFQKFDAGEKFRKKNYVDVNSNAFFQTVSTRDPRDIKV